MPEENFKMDGFRCSLFSGFGWQAKQAPRVAVLFSGGWILLYTDGDWEGCPDSELPPLRIPEPWMALARGIPSGRVPPGVQNFSLILPPHCP